MLSEEGCKGDERRKKGRDGNGARKTERRDGKRGGEKKGKRGQREREGKDDNSEPYTRNTTPMLAITSRR